MKKHALSILLLFAAAGARGGVSEAFSLQHGKTLKVDSGTSGKWGE